TPTPAPTPTPTPTPTFTADLNPVSDTKENGQTHTTSVLDPLFQIDAGNLLVNASTARLLDPQGNVIGTSTVTPEDVKAGTINVPTQQLDDGVYTFTAQTLNAQGQVTGQAPVVVTIVTDRDGVAPSVELAANGGDYNNDGVPDWKQNNVAQLPLTSLENYTAGKNAPTESFGAIMAGSVDVTNPSAPVKLDQDAQLVDLKLAPQPASLPENVSQSSPMLDFTLTSQANSSLHDADSLHAGTQTEVVIDLPSGVVANSYMKWNALSKTWYNFLYDEKTGTGAKLIDTNQDGKIDRVSIILTDCGFGDEDGVVNGTVVDPGELAYSSVPMIKGPSGKLGDPASTRSMAENSATIASMTADESVTWALVGGTDQALFQIDPASGALSFKSAPDFEHPADSVASNSYVVTVQATDAAGISSSQTVTVSVINLDELAPASDKVVTYSLKAGGDAGLLNIDTASGAVTLKSGTLDYETKAGYGFTVVSADASGNHSEQAVSISVGNLDEVAPAFTSAMTASVNELQPRLYTATATDAVEFTDHKVSFSLKKGGDAGLLGIDAASGLVTLKSGTLNNSTGMTSYGFTVVAADASGNQVEQSITVNVKSLAAPVYSVLLGNGDRYYTTNAAEAARMAVGSSNRFEGVKFDSLDGSQGGQMMQAYHQPFTGDWDFAAKNADLPYVCYQLQAASAGFKAAPATLKLGAEFHLYLNGAGITQLVTPGEATSLGLAAKGYLDKGAKFSTTTGNAFVFDPEGYLVANQGNQGVRALVKTLAATYHSTTDAGFIDAVEQNFLTQAALIGLPHGDVGGASDVNAAFGTLFI
ncbi:MAG: hypothetical protein NTX56_09015, partial [Proteobacteria bacterium]|nr:hypothetical protein [Pseudomonadota bacterium]